jgi:hypothetical protein
MPASVLTQVLAYTNVSGYDGQVRAAALVPHTESDV